MKVSFVDVSDVWPGRYGMRSWIVALAFAVLGTGVAAEMQCDRGELIDMASEILKRRGELQGFSGNRVGGDAAYFMLRYGRKNATEVLDALQTGRPYRAADEIIVAQRISALGSAGVTLWGDDPQKILMVGAEPVRRAILLLDNGETFFRIVSEINADAELAEQFQYRWGNGENLHALLTDQPPEVLQQIAERAEAEGHLVVAASLNAMMPGDAYEKFWERVKGSGHQLTDPASPLKMNTNGTIALSRDIALSNPEDIEGIGLRLARQQLLLSLKAGMAEGGTQIIQLTIYSTGREQEMALVSERFLAAIKAGEIEPQRRPEEGWAFLLSAMTDVLGAEYVEQVLTRFDQTADRRHYRGSGLAVLQMATATEAAGQWLRGDVAEAPERPVSLAQSFDWPRALSVWSLVKLGGKLPQEALSGQVLSLALEGHLQRGEFDLALDLAERAGGIIKRLSLARDIMLRQNRVCDQHGIMPGEAVLLGGKLLYDFQ